MAVLASGKVQWGSGAAASDVYIDRSTTNTLNINALTTIVGGSAGAVLLTNSDFHIANGFMYFKNEHPGAGSPPANGCYLRISDNGAGKTQLIATFATGGDIVIASQP